MKICVVGCGLRTPLLIHGLVHSGLTIHEIALYDVAAPRATLMKRLGAAIARDSPIEVVSHPNLPAAVEGAAFVISSFRVGDIETRAQDERLSVECGFAGQETTGPAGFAMALRSIPPALRLVEEVRRSAPRAWIVNFTNPAGIITQAMSEGGHARVIGICDTPGELIHQITRVLDRPAKDVECSYLGLNHLGWVADVTVRGESAMRGLLASDEMLRALYPAELFPAPFLRLLGLIPTEYLFYYYNANRALANQLLAGVTRGEELLRLNKSVIEQLQTRIGTGDADGALGVYRHYLNRRNSSYMRLDGAGESAFVPPDAPWDPFEGATGYHRIAVDVIAALTGAWPKRLILNVRNHGTIADLADDEVVEVPCFVDTSGATPMEKRALPPSVRGLVTSVKNFENLTIRAAREKRRDMAMFALMSNPLIGSWDLAERFTGRLMERDKEHFSTFTAA